MLKLVHPDVGPMPTFVDWSVMSDAELTRALAAHDHGPLPNVYLTVQQLVTLEREELFNWMSDVVANHGPNYSDPSLLEPIIVRRVKMGNEQIEMAHKRWFESKMAEMKKTTDSGLELADSILRAAEELNRPFGTERAVSESAEEGTASEVSSEI